MLKRNYALGSDGCMVHTDTPLLDGWEKCNSLKQLQTFVEHPVRDDIKPDVNWKGTKLPADMLKKVLGTAHAFPTTETGYVLYYNVTRNDWYVQCPEQSGSGGAVRFKGHDTPEGYSEIGTIHTHPNMPAFWSTIDMRDQCGKFGLHIVFGLHNGLADECLCTIFTTLGEYNKELDEICEHVDRTVVYEPDPEWVETIKKQSYKPAWAQPVLPSYVLDGGTPDALRRDDSPAFLTLDSLAGVDARDLKAAAKAQRVQHDERLQTAALRRKADVLDDVADCLLAQLDVEDLKSALDRALGGQGVLIDVDALNEGPEALAKELSPLLDALTEACPSPQEAGGAWDSQLDSLFADYGYIPESLPDWEPPEADEFLSKEAYAEECKRREKLNKAAEQFVLKWIASRGLPEGLKIQGKKGLCSRLLARLNPAKSRSEC